MVFDTLSSVEVSLFMYKFSFDNKQEQYGRKSSLQQTRLQ